MRRRPPHPVRLSWAERKHLDRLLQDGHTEQRVARRARILLAMSDPETSVDLCWLFSLSARTTGTDWPR